MQLEHIADPLRTALIHDPLVDVPELAGCVTFIDGLDQALAASEVYKGIKVDRTNFPKLVAHPTFQTFMQDKRLVLIGLKGKRGKYFVDRDRLAPGFHSEPSD